MSLFQNESKCDPFSYDLHENEHVGETRFHMNGFTLRLVLTRGHRRTPKWPIDLLIL